MWQRKQNILKNELIYLIRLKDVISVCNHIYTQKTQNKDKFHLKPDKTLDFKVQKVVDAFVATAIEYPER